MYTTPPNKQRTINEKNETGNTFNKRNTDNDIKTVINILGAISQILLNNV